MVIGMSKLGLSPEWDRWFDEEFTDLVVTDPDWVRAEFGALIDASFPPDRHGIRVPPPRVAEHPPADHPDPPRYEGRTNQPDDP
jgi:hypothetical protein